MGDKDKNKNKFMQTTATVSYALTTAVKVKDYIGIAQADTSKDYIIANLINETTDFIESYCGRRRFASTTYTGEVYDSRGGRVIFLNQFPIIGSDYTAVTTQYRSGTVTNPNWVTYDPNGYLIYFKEGYLKFYAKLPEISQGLRFTYAAGWLIDFANEFDVTKHTLPKDLTHVCTEIIAKQMNTRQSQGIAQQQTEGQSITYETKVHELTSDHKTILAKYQTLRYSL